MTEQSFSDQLDGRPQRCFLSKVVFSGPEQGTCLQSPSLEQQKCRAALTGLLFKPPRCRALSCKDTSTAFPSFELGTLRPKQPFPRAQLLLLPLAQASCPQ